MLTFHSLRVVDIHPEAEDAVGISLEVPPELRDEYRGLPGQHIVVKTDINDEENRRTYSLVSAPGEWPLRIVARVHSAGQMSRYLAEQLNAGDHLDVLPPNGSFTPRRAQAGGTYVAFASGCGITPVLAIARSLLAARPDNRVLVFYGNASTGRTMCLEELLALKDRYLRRLSLHFVMSREPQEVELYNGRIDAGRVRQFAQALFAPAAVTEYFVCGPGNMLDEVSTTLRELGVEADRIHGEHFTVATTVGGGASTDAPVAAGSAGAARQAPLREPDRSDVAGRSGTTATVAPDQCEVTVLMDGRRRTFTMQMNDEVVLDAAARAGLELPFSCRAGVCSTCRTKVVKGEVEMAQNYALEEWEVEQGYVLACQSHVKTPVLELDYDEK
jgi:ring-1,2-phenylacetyl-CoA epoxidase subunit PaaE